MSKLIDDFVSSHITVENSNGFEEFSEISEDIYLEAAKSPSIYLSKIIEGIGSYPDEYITALIEYLLQQISHKELAPILGPIYKNSSNIGKSIIIDTLYLLASKHAIDFLINLDINEPQLEIRRLDAIADIEKSIKTKEIQDYLIIGYSTPDLPPPSKQTIYECLRDVYQLQLEIDSDHKDWLSTKNQAHLSLVLKSAQEEFKKARYKTVIKLLSQFEASELPELGVKLLKIAKRKIA